MELDSKKKMEIYPVFRTESRRSKTLEIKGFRKSTSEQEITDVLSDIEFPTELDFSSRLSKRSKVYVTYENIEVAAAMIHTLHQLNYNGAILSARYELGFDENGLRYIDHSSHNTAVRAVRSESGMQIPNQMGFTYNFNSVTVDQVQFPFPSGLYLSRVLDLTRTLPSTDPLLDLLTNSRKSGGATKHTKEVSEAMAMVDCLERAIKRVYGISPSQLTKCDVRLYVIGDGKNPMCSASMCLHFPSQWKYYSIDPILDVIPDEELGEYASRFFQYRGYSETFIIPSQETDEEEVEDGDDSCNDTLSIVVACHSHAPLHEFWTRIPSPKLGIVMPCCADYSDLPGETPIIDFEDFEVLSPRRHVFVYSK